MRIGFLLAVSVRRRVLMIGPFVIIMMVVADVKMEVKETGAHLAVVVPVVGRTQSETSGTYCAHQQQAWARRRQQSVYGLAESSHFAAPGVLYRSLQAGLAWWGFSGTRFIEFPTRPFVSPIELCRDSSFAPKTDRVGNLARATLKVG